MFEQIKNLPQRNAILSLARLIVASDSKSVYAPVEKIDKYITAGATELVKGQLNPADPTQVVVGLTPDALAAATGLPAATEQPAANRGPRGPITFEMGELDELPEVSKGGNKGDSYPFADLVAPKPKMDPANPTVQLTNAKGELAFTYAKFFVPATAQRENPAKSLQSTAASATKRYEKEGRKFIAVKVTDATGKITGANVIRIK